MSSLLPVAVYGLKVPAGDVLVPANIDFPATFRITMAAIDPSAEPEHNGEVNGSAPAPRATLKIIYDPNGPREDEDSDDDSEDEDYLKGLLGGAGSDEDDDDDESTDDEEEKNGGPSDPSKSKKARKQAAVEQMMKALAENDTDDEMDDVPAVSGAISTKQKGKGKATDIDEESDDENGDEMPEMEELVLCTLDPSKNYQQPLDITVGEDQRAFFKVSGTHAIYLTGNYVVPADDGHKHQHDVYDGDDDSEDYDLSPDEDEFDEEGESDDLDDLEDPRIVELGSDEEQAPKLVRKEETPNKGKNKRVAEDSDEEPANLDDTIAKSLKPAEPTTNGEPKLSKKQLKKLKNNAGKAVEAASENKDVKKDDKKEAKKEVKKDPKKDAKEDAATEVASPKLDKKVQFAKNLEQGPATAAKDKKADTKAESKSETKKEGEKPKASLGVKTIQGVTIDDRELGKGPAAKKGNKVGMRYIGKLEDGKVFDANKKGKPFTFTLGTGEVIKGWDIGVVGMSVGGTRRITVPASLAYGSKSLPGIPANSTLIFDIKMLEIH